MRAEAARSKLHRLFGVESPSLPERSLMRNADADDGARVVALQSWLSSPAYQGTPWDASSPAMELPLYGIAPPTIVASVAETLAQLEQGAFFSAAYLWDGMQRDDRVGAKLKERLDGLFGSKLDLLPADSSDEARAVKEKYEKRIARICPSAQLKKLMRNGIGLSVGVAQVLSTRTSKTRDAQIRTWNNRHLRYDWLLRQYRLVTENRGEITIDPEDDEWLIYEPYGPHGWLDSALIRPLAAPWLIRHWTRTWWARRQEVHGSPIRAGIIPAERDPTDERTFLRQLANLAHEATIRLPQGQDGNKFDVKLIEAAAANMSGFSQLLEHCDSAIEITFLGQSQSTEGQGGLGTQEKAGESTIMRILRGDSQVSEPLRDRVLMPLVRDNEGNAELAPYLAWQLDPPEDLERKSRGLLNVANAVKTLAEAPEYEKHIDKRALLDEHQLPLVAEDKVPPDIPGAPESDPSDEDEQEETAA
jgi:hypothetical protein